MMSILKNSKKYLLIIFFIISICTLLISAFGQTLIYVSANSTIDNQNNLHDKNIEMELEELIKGQLNELDLTELQNYINSLQNTSNESIIDRLMNYIKGEGVDYEAFGKELLKIILWKMEELLPSFLCMLSITLLIGFISMLRSMSVGNSVGDIIFLIGFVAMLIPILSVLTTAIEQTFACIKTLQKQMQLIFPLILTLMAVSGGTVSVAVVRPAVAFFSSGIIALITNVVLPLTIIIIAFSIAGNLSRELKINKFTQFFKSINKWVIGISISVFSLFITMQGITTASYDGIMRRAAKYAIGNGVPIIGGFLSGGFDLAVAGSFLIKNSLGNMGIFLMISVVLEPFVLLLSLNLLFRLQSLYSNCSRYH